MSDVEQERQSERYRSSGMAAVLGAEMDVLGSDYQANGYTTMAQADLLGDVLELQPGQRLLDLGAGCGWPGLYLASRHGCSVVSIDPVAEGVGTARRRAGSDGLADRVLTLVGEGLHLPLPPRSVDAVVHTDVL